MNRKEFNMINVNIEMLGETGKIELSFKDLLKHYYPSVSIAKARVLKEKAKNPIFIQDLESLNNDDWILFESNRLYINLSICDYSDVKVSVFNLLDIINPNIKLSEVI